MALLSTDRLDRRLDTDGDMFIGPNGSEPISGIDGVAQLIVIALRLFKEEWFLNLDKGVPFFQEILGEKLDEQLVRKRFSEAILAAPGVVAITSMVLDFTSSTRSLLLTLSVRTAFGDTPSDFIKFRIGQ